jgi:uncharacterized membrane protein YcaP (DUF421 family)
VELHWIWKAILIVLIGTLLLRVAGRKSISQMTVAQTVIMISIGSLLIQPVAGRNLWTTFGVAGLLVATLILLEYVQLKSDKLESFFSGNSLTVVENGVINEKNMKKLRFTTDKLEMRLRQLNVSKLSDVKWATLEPNGQLGYMLHPNAQPATKQDIQNLVELINSKMPAPQSNLHVNQSNQMEDIFTEVYKKGHRNPPPEHLQ